MFITNGYYTKSKRLYSLDSLLFLQESYSNSIAEQEWKEDFHGQVFFSYGKQILAVS